MNRDAEEWGEMLATFPPLTDTTFRRPTSDDPATWCQVLQLWWVSGMARRALEMEPGTCVTCGEPNGRLCLDCWWAAEGYTEAIREARR